MLQAPPTVVPDVGGMRGTPLQPQGCEEVAVYTRYSGDTTATLGLPTLLL